MLEGSTGPITAPDLAALRLPDELISITLLSLQGGRGPDDPGNPDWAPAALGVVQVELDASLVGAWVHVAPLDFDLETSERKRLAGGGGRLVAAGGNARATVLVTLPPGDATPDEDDVVAFDVEIAARDGKRLIGTQKAPRTPRPPETPARSRSAPRAVSRRRRPPWSSARPASGCSPGARSSCPPVPR